jgi:ketosteroid isomerase-like protein
VAATASEKAIKQTIQARNAALSAKDVAGVMASGAAGFVSYNLAPPLRATGAKAGLAAWFATWDGPIGYEMPTSRSTPATKPASRTVWCT